MENIRSQHPELDTAKAWIAKLLEEGMGRSDCPELLRGMKPDFNWGEEMDSDASRAFWMKLKDGTEIMVGFSKD